MKILKVETRVGDKEMRSVIKCFVSRPKHGTELSVPSCRALLITSKFLLIPCNVGRMLSACISPTLDLLIDEQCWQTLS